MRQFAKSWNFEIITTSPFYARSNGFAEKGVGISKSMLKKSKESGTDIDLMLLEYRNMPIVSIGYIPSQILMSRNARTKIIISQEKLIPKVQTDVK